MTDKIGEALTKVIGDMFMSRKEIQPIILVPAKEGFAVLPVSHFAEVDNLLPQLISKTMQQSKSKIVAFASEAKRIDNKDDKDVVMICLYEESGTSIWNAEIMRSGDWAELKEWEKVTNGEVAGRMGKLPKPQPDPRWN